MAATAEYSGLSRSTHEARPRPLPGGALAWLVVLASAWFVGGVFLDGWAHNHGKVDNTFFTPWHAVLYSGYGALAGVHLAALARNHAAIHAWRAALPEGYRLSLLGALVFAVAGLGDMIWHTLFGIEVGTAALLSPTHLMLATGGALMVSGPLRQAWRQTATARLSWRGRATLPILLSFSGVLAILTFMTQFAHPFVWPQASSVQTAGPVENADVYAMSADGTTQRRVTRLHGVFAYAAASSPDGQRLLFVTRNPTDDVVHLNVADSTGNVQAVLATGNRASGLDFPVWSPDGSRVAYIARRDGAPPELNIVDAAGGVGQQLSIPGLVNAPIGWSPDGAEIALSQDINGTEQIALFRLDGTGATPLTDANPGPAAAPTWSPDGSRIAFGAERDGNTEVYVVNRDGSGLRQLTNTHSENGRPASSYWPTWSPDGGTLVFLSNRTGNSEIYAMRPDGTEQVNLSDNPSLESYQPGWSADGRQISFTARGHTLDADMNPALGVAGILLQTAILVGGVLLLAGRWTLPFGALTLVIGLNAVLLAFLNDTFFLIPAAVVAGLAGDVMLRWWRPFSGSNRGLHIFAFSLAVVLMAGYFVALQLAQGIGWTVHLWAGAVVLAGITAWLLSYLYTARQTSYSSLRAN